MLKEKDLQRIIWNAEQSMEKDGNLDLNLAASELRIAAEKLLVLLKCPSMRPIQEQYHLLMVGEVQLRNET